MKHGNKRYEGTNHLGNVLVVYSDKRLIGKCDADTVTYYKADLISATDYSSFGAPIKQFYANDDTSGYKFGFNGQEKDNELYSEGGAYNFGARIYDSRLGRWLSCDPLQAEYSSFSPYNYSWNSPIYLKDDNGRFIIVVPIIVAGATVLVAVAITYVAYQSIKNAFEASPMTLAKGSDYPEDLRRVQERSRKKNEALRVGYQVALTKAVTEHLKEKDHGGPDWKPPGKGEKAAILTIGGLFTTLYMVNEVHVTVKQSTLEKKEEWQEASNEVVEIHSSMMKDSNIDSKKQQKLNNAIEKRELAFLEYQASQDAQDELEEDLKQLNYQKIIFEQNTQVQQDNTNVYKTPELK